MAQDLELAEAPVVVEAEAPHTPILWDGVQQHLVLWLEDTGQEIIRATRTWLQYGAVGFAVLCILIGALEGLLGR